MVAPAGAGPWPQITSVRERLTSCTMIGTSPPGPLRCGSTTCRVKAVATAASKALPPFSRVAMPTAVAIQCVEVTTPKVPSISGRVVNAFGLMLVMGDPFGAGLWAEQAWGLLGGDVVLAGDRSIAPYLRGNQGAERLRRAAAHGHALLVKLRRHIGLADDAIHGGVEPVDDRAR